MPLRRPPTASVKGDYGDERERDIGDEGKMMVMEDTMEARGDERKNCMEDWKTDWGEREDMEERDDVKDFEGLSVSRCRPWEEGKKVREVEFFYSEENHAKTQI